MWVDRLIRMVPFCRKSRPVRLLESLRFVKKVSGRSGLTAVAASLDSTLLLADSMDGWLLWPAILLPWLGRATRRLIVTRRSIDRRAKTEWRWAASVAMIRLVRGQPSAVGVRKTGWRKRARVRLACRGKFAIGDPSAGIGSGGGPAAFLRLQCA